MFNQELGIVLLPAGPAQRTESEAMNPLRKTANKYVIIKRK